MFGGEFHITAEMIRVKLSDHSPRLGAFGRFQIRNFAGNAKRKMQNAKYKKPILNFEF